MISRNLYYQGSNQSTARGIELAFVKTRAILENFPNYIPVLFFDEIGMAENSPNNPLKVLHKLFDDFSTDMKGRLNYY